MTPGTVDHQTPLSMGFSRQEYWSGLPCPPPGDLPNPGIEPMSLMPPALSGRFLLWPPAKPTGVGSYFLLQGIFLTQGSNPGLLHRKQILDHLSHQGSTCLFYTRSDKEVTTHTVRYQIVSYLEELLFCPVLAQSQSSPTWRSQKGLVFGSPEEERPGSAAASSAALASRVHVCRRLSHA